MQPETSQLQVEHKGLNQALTDKMTSKYIRQKTPDSFEALRRIHHVLMCKYGYILFDEFVNLPMVTVFNLLEEIRYDYETEKKEYEKSASKSKLRR